MENVLIEDISTIAVTGRNPRFQTKYEISRETAVRWRRNWEADNAVSGKTEFIRAFRIDVEELRVIMAIPGTAFVRDDKARFFDFTSPCPTNCDGGLPGGLPSDDDAWWA